MMKGWLNWIEEYPVLGPSVILKAGATVLIIIVSVSLYKIAKKILDKRSGRAEKIYAWKKIILYVTVVLAVLAILRVWIEGVQTVITFLGILSAGIAIALKDVFANIAGWLMIVWRAPFNIGDRIEIGDIAGDVVDIRLFQFTLLEIRNWVKADQNTGRLIHVPNARVFQYPQANYTQGFQYIWNEISVMVTFESNYKKTAKIVKNILNKVAGPLGEGATLEFEEARKRFLILTGTVAPKVYTNIADSGVNLTMRYLVPARKRRDSEHQIWEMILDRFEKHPDIQLAYPTTRIYFEKERLDAQSVK